jgi:hypothetical protein
VDMPGETAEPGREAGVSAVRTPGMKQDRRHDDIPRAQPGIEPTRQPEADQAGRAAVQQPGGNASSPRRRPPPGPDRPASRRDDPGLGRKADDDAGQGTQNPNSTRPVLPRRRLR